MLGRQFIQCNRAVVLMFLMLRYVMTHGEMVLDNVRLKLKEMKEWSETERSIAEQSEALIPEQQIKSKMLPLQ